TPGTAELLKGIPLAEVPIDAELTTPTGAAILKTLVTRFGPLPTMSIERIGYGAGTKDFPDRANILRLIVGTAASAPQSDRVLLLETNLDDVSAETIGYARQKLLAAGALDVYSVSIQMKKDRPGTLLAVICRLEDGERLEAILFAETATFGVRRQIIERHKRVRQACTVETPWGPVAAKLGRHAASVVFTPEYDSCARLAAQYAVPLRDVYRAAELAFEQNKAALIAGLDSMGNVSKDAPSDHSHEHTHEQSRDDAHDHDHSHDHSHDHDHGDGHHHHH
ncbi:MAG: LarC family nickel insertion protein, partial [Deltaproteobacteria bacterium]